MGIIVAVIASALCAVLYVRMVKREKPERMPKKQSRTPVIVGIFAPFLSTILTLLISLIIKTLLSESVTDALRSNWIIASHFKSFFAAGMTEELVKFLLFLVLYKSLKPKNVYEVAVMVAGIGFGFTVLEEIIYGGGSAIASLMRLPTFAMHMVIGLVMGIFLGLAYYKKQKGESSGIYYFLGLFLPILWHTVYDASTVSNVAFAAEDEYVQFQGLLFGLAVVVISTVLQFVLLIVFKVKTEKYCGMALRENEA
ncbi:MAG: PrsW family intramembrane metalloprotease [Clostridiales bacterium]|nr:PrsW family intramembrane metalloprotease [Clostridiales bacterium]